MLDLPYASADISVDCPSCGVNNNQSIENCYIVEDRDYGVVSYVLVFQCGECKAEMQLI